MVHMKNHFKSIPILLVPLCMATQGALAEKTHKSEAHPYSKTSNVIGGV